MEQDAVTLSSQEATDLALSILEGVTAIDEGRQARTSWTAEMRDWSLMLLARKEGGA